MAEPAETTECVVNISEGRDLRVVEFVAAAGGDTLLDVHSDPLHHRSVLTLGGPLEAVEHAAREVVAAAVGRIDLRTHEGVHPRLGAADVVPFVTLGPAVPGVPGFERVLAARDRFARWAGTELSLPCFLYGPERSLPEVRRGAFSTLVPETGPSRPHPTAGAAAVGARGVLVAYNVWIERSTEGGGSALAAAREIAVEMRSPSVRALGLAAGTDAQVSLNLLDPAVVSIPDAYDAVASGARSRGCAVVRAELVGLVPGALVEAVSPRRRSELDLSEETTLEARLAGARPAPPAWR